MSTLSATFLRSAVSAGPLGFLERDNRRASEQKARFDFMKRFLMFAPLAVARGASALFPK
jgi:hypothetical protein